MLEVLKEQLREDKTTDLVMEAVQTQDVRDIFLDGMDAVTLGAENDSSINSFIDKIPMYEEYDTEFAKEVEALTESSLLELE